MLLEIRLQNIINQHNKLAKVGFNLYFEEYMGNYNICINTSSKIYK